MEQLYRTADMANKFLISPSYKHMPVSFTDINDWLAAKHLFPEYIAEMPIGPHCDDTIIPLDVSVDFFIKQKVDYIILRDKLSTIIDDGSLSNKLSDFVDNNNDMVKQYLNGNGKIVNSLLGRFLKDNKGYDPQQVKELIEKILVSKR